MNYQGLILGAAAFLIIGLFHPIVIKAEYHFTKRIWPAFLVVGIALVAWSLFIDNFTLSVLVGITGFSSLWSIHEIIEQEDRVRKGWFPCKEERDLPPLEYTDYRKK